MWSGINVHLNQGLIEQNMAGKQYKGSSLKDVQKNYLLWMQPSTHLADIHTPMEY